MESGGRGGGRGRRTPQIAANTHTWSEEAQRSNCNSTKDALHCETDKHKNAERNLGRLSLRRVQEAREGGCSNSEGLTASESTTTETLQQTRQRDHKLPWTRDSEEEATPTEGRVRGTTEVLGERCQTAGDERCQEKVSFPLVVTADNNTRRGTGLQGNHKAGEDTDTRCLPGSCRVATRFRQGVRHNTF